MLGIGDRQRLEGNRDRVATLEHGGGAQRQQRFPLASCVQRVSEEAEAIVATDVDRVREPVVVESPGRGLDGEPLDLRGRPVRPQTFEGRERPLSPIRNEQRPDDGPESSRTDPAQRLGDRVPNRDVVVGEHRDQHRDRALGVDRGHRARGLRANRGGGIEKPRGSQVE